MSQRLPVVPPEIEALVPYQPGKSIEELERELDIAGAIKLASNENPLGPSPKALAAMAAALTNLHRYSDGAGHALRTALAARFGVAFDQTCIGNGSDEIIEFLARAYVRPGHSPGLHQQPRQSRRNGVSKSELAAFLDACPQGVLVVLDEAYTDFASDPDVAQRVDFLGTRRRWW